jgi:hypothetical protein
LESYWSNRLDTILGGFAVEWPCKSSVGDCFVVRLHRIALLERIAFKEKNIGEKGGE